MAFSYTKASLKTHLNSWVEGNGTDADAEFIAALDEIIQRGEARLYRDLDLDSLDSVVQTTTADTVPEVFKPENLVSERLVVISISGVKRQLLKRSRAWIEAMNRADANAAPVYFGEYDEDRWFLAPIPNGAYLIYVHGIYRPASIVDGSDSNTTWFSTRFPDVLAAACDIEAARKLKNWSRVAASEAEYIGKLDNVLAQTKNLKRADVEDIIGARNVVSTPTGPGEPEGTV
jgi:hypothetical protein